MSHPSFRVVDGSSVGALASGTSLLWVVDRGDVDRRENGTVAERDVDLSPVGGCARAEDREPDVPERGADGGARQDADVRPRGRHRSARLPETSHLTPPR